ncbi:developmental regulator [Lichtheimia corymbifera JMRC:FSU:9682]|uniref:Developmental regulator n=1 Tax=Lichtheimia corymbifera JMRC:FSU:9682 TaxID=1263082 RepID=A0A068SDS9_9FUNG|nr:developmental regulator [Lichtheimia corymbifera JMRC:FSU:9682]
MLKRTAMLTQTSFRDYNLNLRQQPRLTKVCSPNERDRRQPIDPPPILKLEWVHRSQNITRDFLLQSPFYYVMANLVAADDPTCTLLPSQEYLVGTTVSSLYRLRDIDNRDAGFFIFGDLAVIKEGQFRLHFSLFEMTGDEVRNCKTIMTEPFIVYPSKRFPGFDESTFLTRSFSDQGVRLRIRKQHRINHTQQQQQAKKRKLQVIQVVPPSSSSSSHSSPCRNNTHTTPKMMKPTTAASFMASPPPEDDDICIQLPPLHSILKGGHVNNYHELTLPPLLCNVQHQ